MHGGAAGPPASINNDLAGTASDVSLAFACNPANQIVSRLLTNDAYAWTGSVAVDRTCSVNGQSQYMAVGAAGGALVHGNCSFPPSCCRDIARRGGAW